MRKRDLETIKLPRRAAVPAVQKEKRSNQAPSRCSIGKDGHQTHSPAVYPQEVNCAVLVEIVQTRTIVSTARKTVTVTAGKLHSL